jgi:hypothetical protein
MSWRKDLRRAHAQVEQSAAILARRHRLLRQLTADAAKPEDIASARKHFEQSVAELAEAEEIVEWLLAKDGWYQQLVRSPDRRR